MWIYFATIVNIVLCSGFKSSDDAPTQAMFCEYKTSVDPFLAKALSKQRLSGRGTFVRNGYEQCDSSQGIGYCYNLWLPTTQGKVRVTKQGCWLVPTAGQSTCSDRRCTLETSTETRLHSNLTVNFCCCYGSRCNDLKEESKDINKETSLPNVVPKVAAKLSSDKQTDSPAVATIPANHTVCAYRWDPKEDIESGKNHAETNGLGRLIDNGQSVVCPDQGSSCFSTWKVDPDDNRTHIVYQGCWRQTCESSICHPERNTHKGVFFCCCRGNMCNNNMSKEFVNRTTTTTGLAGPEAHPLHDPSYKERTIIISLLSVFFLAIIILAFYFVYRFCFHPQQMPVSTNPHLESSLDAPGFDIEDLKICSVLNRGRFSEVWKGSLNEQDVVVKIYSPPYRQYYYNEKYIYSLPNMEHENIVKFCGGEERLVANGSMQYLLVMQYVPDGTLMNYLKNNTIDWYTMCKMCHTMACGLAHLHCDIGTGDKFKPTVAHRDFNSRNVLVKPDLGCLICDLGFCMTTMGSKLIHKSHTENAEQTSLTDVGTLRYMAPELLDGAVNLRDCEASLKQIDMYAFGLVMWEISSRCMDLYQGCPMPEYALPFQVEIGNHPSFEEMQLAVSRNKTRPKFPEVWKEYNPAIRALKETIEECWDHDAEARLTSLCVEERVMDMKLLWSHDSRNKGVTPTINTALLSQVTTGNKPSNYGNSITQRENIYNMDVSPNVVAEGNTSALIINDIHSSTASASESLSYHPPSWIHERSGSVSTSTMETTVAQTPVDVVPPPLKSQNVNALKNQPLPVHQGRNPTVERNTHKRSDEELAVVGNNLFYGKDQSDPPQNVPGNVENVFDSLGDNLETSLMQNDVLSRHRNAPISYLQNQMHSNSGELPPKMVNNPSETNLQQTRQNDRNVSVGGKQKGKKPKEMGIFGHLALLGKLAFGGKADGKKNLSENSPGGLRRVENGTTYESIGQYNPIFETRSPSQTVETEVRLTNLGTVVRPANLGASHGTNASSESDHSNVNAYHDNQSECVDTGDTGVEEQRQSPQFSRLRGAPYSKSTSDLSPQKKQRLASKEDHVRPSTLSLMGHNYHVAKYSGSSLNSLSSLKGLHSNNITKGLGNRKALPNGFKEPYEPTNTKYELQSLDKVGSHIQAQLLEKQARLSLYDDRLMSDNINPDATQVDELRKPSISLQQFNGVENGVANHISADCPC